MMRAKFDGKFKVRFGEPLLQRTPATAGKLSDGQAFQPTREPPAHKRASCVFPQPYPETPKSESDWYWSRNAPMSEVSDQLRAAALARARWLQAARKAFISARNTIIRVATPLYFFVIPMTVRLTAPR